jgi:hypothetical protein
LIEKLSSNTSRQNKEGDSNSQNYNNFTKKGDIINKIDDYFFDE